MYFGQGHKPCQPRVTFIFILYLYISLGSFFKLVFRLFLSFIFVIFFLKGLNCLLSQKFNVILSFISPFCKYTKIINKICYLLIRISHCLSINKSHKLCKNLERSKHTHIHTHTYPYIFKYIYENKPLLNVNSMTSWRLWNRRVISS